MRSAPTVCSCAGRGDRPRPRVADRTKAALYPRISQRSLTFSPPSSRGAKLSGTVQSPVLCEDRGRVSQSLPPSAGMAAPKQTDERETQSAGFFGSKLVSRFDTPGQRSLMRRIGRIKKKEPGGSFRFGNELLAVEAHRLAIRRHDQLVAVDRPVYFNSFAD